jgi:hypothetical protein
LGIDYPPISSAEPESFFPLLSIESLISSFYFVYSLAVSSVLRTSELTALILKFEVRFE